MPGQPSAGTTPPRPVDEWTTLFAETPRATRQILRSLFLDNRDELEQRYRAHMHGDPDICAILSKADGFDQMLAMFLRWMDDITDVEFSTSETLARRQEELGEKLARISYPPHAISSSQRKIKLWFLDHLSRMELPRAEFLGAVRYAICAIDLSVELRTVGFQRGLKSLSRVDEAYRLYSLGQNLAMERERQRALLMEWGHRLLSSFYQRPGEGGLQRLWKSDFGLWVNHKARIIFEHENLLKAVTDAVDRIDTDLVPALERTGLADSTVVRDLTRRVEEELGTIKFSLTTLFDKHLEMESGHDPLTQLLSRRFMPSVLARELQLQRGANAHGFCVLLVDIDNFNEVNVQHGQSGGDTVLQQVASVVNHCARPSDFVFRYGGEEIAVVLVDCGLDTGQQIAQRIRDSVEGLTIRLPRGEPISLTVSIGVAPFSGELDYEAVVRRADFAMHQAKARGRNQVVVSGI